MRAALMLISILGCAAKYGVAQTSQPPAPAEAKLAQHGASGPSRAADRQERRARKKNTTNEALASCLAQWDKGTHMSRQEWSRACRRVADRLQNLNVK